MNINDVSLSAFTKMASLEKNENAKIKLSDDGLKSTSLATFASTNHKAMSAFIDAIKKDLGSAIADMASTHIHSKIGEDKPLTVRVVRDTLDQITRMAQSQINARDKFLSGVEPNNSFDKSFDSFISGRGKAVYGKMSDETKALFKESVKEQFAQRTIPGKADNINFSNLGHEVGSGRSLEYIVSTMCEDISLSGSEPLINKNIIEICKSGISIEQGGGLLELMPEIKDSSLEKPITMGDVWQTLFNEPFPECDVNTDSTIRSELRDRLNQRIVTLLEEKTGIPGQKVSSLCNHMSLEHATELIHNRCARASDFPGFETAFGLQGLNYTGEAEKSFCKDINRRGDSVALDGARRGERISTPSTISIGDESFKVGKNTDFKFKDKSDDGKNSADMSDYRVGRPSSLSAAIMKSVRSLCSDDVSGRQSEMVGHLLGQKITSRMLGTGRGVLKVTLAQTQYIEHCPSKISVTKKDNGTVGLRVQSYDDPEVVRNAGMFSIEYEIYKDGQFKPVDMMFMSKFNDKANAFADAIDSGSTSSDVLKDQIDSSLSAKEISDFEKEQLLRRLELKSA